MRRFQQAVLVGSAVCLHILPSHAIGFGKVAAPTFLGQPFEFSATVRLDAEETLERACVAAQVEAGDHRIAPEQVRVVLLRAPEAGDRIVRVTTLRKVDEPIVNVQITVGCAAPLSRRFVAFLDPPAMQLAQIGEGDATTTNAMPDGNRASSSGERATDAVLAASASMTPQRETPAGGPRAAGHPPRRTARAVLPADVPSKSAPVLAANAATRRGGASAHAIARTRPAGAPRLQLEAAPILRARAEPEPARTSPAAANAAATVADLAERLAAKDAAVQTLEAALAKERERMHGLETGMAELGAETRSMRQAMATLQARLQQAEAERHANPLVIVLGAACALLAAIVASGAWLASTRRRSRWWDLTQEPETAVAATARPAMPTSSRAALDAETAEEPAAALTEADADAPFVYRPPRLPPMPAPTAVEPHASSLGGLEVTTVLDPGFLARLHAAESAANAEAGDAAEAPAPAADREPAPLTIEALIDLDQQVEFFLLLGRDDAAIERLSSHLRRGDDASPLLHLHLLEIHRRRGDERAFTRVAEAFAQRFGAPAPAWAMPACGEASGEAAALESHPSAVATIQSAWSTPQGAMQAIEDALFRRRPADPMLDGPGYRELLSLHPVARALAEGPARDDIDLLLPIDDADAGEETRPIETTPSRFAELYALPSRSAALDLDISVDAPTAARRATR